jgi:uncharacterized protein YdhG (YjbR/CyaY superfamily)
MPDRKRPARKAKSDGTAGFSAEEKAAMREAVKEHKAAAGHGPAGGEGLADVLAKIAEMPEPDRTMAERIHALVTAAAPELAPRTWYGSPAYSKDGKVVCFFQGRSKFKTRYATFGFQQDAHLDHGTMWATSYALLDLTPADEARLTELVKRAAG